jgi:hypothetical protein
MLSRLYYYFGINLIVFPLDPLKGLIYYEFASFCRIHHLITRSNYGGK